MYPIPISETAKPYESYVPRPSRTFLFECLQYAKTEGEGLVHCIYLGIQRLMGGVPDRHNKLEVFSCSFHPSTRVLNVSKVEADRLLTDQDKYMKHILSIRDPRLPRRHSHMAGLPSLFLHIGK